MQSLLVNQSPVSELTYSNKMRVIYDGVEQDAELRKYPSGKVYFRTEGAHFVPVNEVGMLIPISKGKSVIVDYEDYDRLLKMGKWHYSKGGYVCKTKVFPRINGKQPKESVYMHRIIMNTPDGMVTDHIDGNGLNNQKSNLRICTQAENNLNKKIKGKYKGIKFYQGKWHSEIKFKGEYKYLGSYESAEQAALAYNEVAKELHGAYAILNVVNEPFKGFTKKAQFSSKFNGVSFHKTTNKWTAYLIISRKQKYLGIFENEQDAALAYNTAALAHYGASAKLNTIPND